jgi:chromate transport protein ChrA
VGLAILIHFVIALLQKQLPARFAYYIGGWAALSLLMFFFFDPYLWPHPLERLIKSVTFHEAFQGSRLVQQYHYPFWQPFRWMAAFSANYDLHPRQAFLFNIDTMIFVLAAVGLPALFRKARFYFYWLITGVVFLLLWETKWPQYTLIILAPLSMSAAYGVFTLSDLARWFLARNRQPSAAL